MTILEAIETEVGNLSSKVTYKYAGNLEEANATMFDNIKPEEYPVCLILAFDIEDYNRENGRVQSQAEINALFLDRIESQASIDAITSEVETSIIAPMRALTRELVNRLDQNDIIEEEGIGSVTNRNTYEALMDAHLYGNWAVFTIKFSEDITTCVPV